MQEEEHRPNPSTVSLNSAHHSSSLISAHHSGLVTLVSTTVPGGGLERSRPLAANRRVLILFFTTITVNLGLQKRGGRGGGRGEGGRGGEGRKGGGDESSSSDTPYKGTRQVPLLVIGRCLFEGVRHLRHLVLHHCCQLREGGMGQLNPTTPTALTRTCPSPTPSR